MIDIIEHLPNDILDIIFYYVNPREKIFLNKNTILNIIPI